jgi:hypothetical protein
MTSLDIHSCDSIEVSRWTGPTADKLLGLSLKLGDSVQVTFYNEAIAAFEQMVEDESGCIPIPLTGEDISIILLGATKVFVDDRAPFEVDHKEGDATCIVVSGEGNRCGTAWVDPVDGMPVFKPSGSTPNAKED